MQSRQLSRFFGVLAQLVERLNGIEEVRGSNPLGSTSLSRPKPTPKHSWGTSSEVIAIRKQNQTRTIFVY